MDVERFGALVAAYGSDPRRWPVGERAAALALLTSSEEAARLAAEAERLDALLDQAADAAVPEMDASALVEAIVSRAPRQNALRRRSNGWRVRIGWPPVALLAAASIAGFVVGWTGESVPDTDPQTTSQSTLIDLLIGSLNGEEAEW
jgi:hypothetical protein